MLGVFVSKTWPVIQWRRIVVVVLQTVQASVSKGLMQHEWRQFILSRKNEILLMHYWHVNFANRSLKRRYINKVVLPWSACDKRLFFLYCINKKVPPPPPQAWQQMKNQTQESSRIVVALTDGKLSPYILEITIKEVRSLERGGGGACDSIVDIAFIFPSFLKHLW